MIQSSPTGAASASIAGVQKAMPSQQPASRLRWLS